MRKEVQVVKLDQNGNVDDILQSVQTHQDAERWLEENQKEIGGRMSNVYVTIRTVYVL
jgi:hypothetical protein